jgi:hypothetical protein
MKLNFIILSTFLFFISINLQSQDKIPNVTLKTLEGKSINSKSTFNKNGLTIYSFWAIPVIAIGRVTFLECARS